MYPSPNNRRFSNSKSLHGSGSKTVVARQAAQRVGLSVTKAIAAPAAPAGQFTVDENAVLDAVIVGAGISGLTTALVRFSLCWRLLLCSLLVRV